MKVITADTLACPGYWAKSEIFVDFVAGSGNLELYHLLHRCETLQGVF
jgi:hypothetical protein